MRLQPPQIIWVCPDILRYKRSNDQYMHACVLPVGDTHLKLQIELKKTVPSVKTAFSWNVIVKCFDLLQTTSKSNSRKSRHPSHRFCFGANPRDWCQRGLHIHLPWSRRDGRHQCEPQIGQVEPPCDHHRVRAGSLSGRHQDLSPAHPWPVLPQQILHCQLPSPSPSLRWFDHIKQEEVKSLIYSWIKCTILHEIGGRRSRSLYLRRKEGSCWRRRPTRLRRSQLLWCLSFQQLWLWSTMLHPAPLLSQILQNSDSPLAPD